jgi:predicted transcriptional regulator
MSGRAAILSVKPKYAAAILDRTKTIELRTRRVALPVGTPLAIYATSPTRAVVGTARIARVMWCSTDAAWDAAGCSLALTRGEFDEYTAGREIVSLLFLEGAASVATPIRLAHLRSAAAFYPPQSYRYVSSTDPSCLRSLVLGAAVQHNVGTPPRAPLTQRLLPT